MFETVAAILAAEWGVRFAGEVEEVHAEEGDDKAGQKCNGVCPAASVESLVQDKGRKDRAAGEADIIHGVDTACEQSAYGHGHDRIRELTHSW